MPKGIHVKIDLEAMIVMLIKERKIALPAQRFIWYAKWFKIDCDEQTVKKTLYRMVREGTLMSVKDGGMTYYKLDVRRKQ